MRRGDMTRKTIVTLGLASLLVLTASAHTSAASIRLRAVPHPTGGSAFPVGDPLTIEILALLGADEIALGVGAFDTTIQFDPGLLTFTGITFGSSLGALGSESDDFSLGAIGNTVNVSQVSYLTPSELLARQAPAGSSLRLASLTFTAAAPGGPMFDTLAAILSSADGTQAFEMGVLGDLARISIFQPDPPPQSVPEPTTALLLGSGLVAALLARRRAPR
jgi:hypothetical protein